MYFFHNVMCEMLGMGIIMKFIKFIIIVLVISAVGFASWFMIGKKSVQNIPKRATFVININIDDRGTLYEVI